MVEAPPHKVGIVVPLTGPKSRLGRGIVRSIEKYLGWEYGRELSGNFGGIELVIEDDRSEPSLVGAAVERCLAAGAVAIIGPADSACVHTIADNPDYEAVPFILSFATRTALLDGSRGNFFRVTTPDQRRVMILLRFIVNTLKARDLTVFTLDDHPQSYSVGLRDDLTASAKLLGINLVHVSFSAAELNVPKETERHPVVICAPSQEAVGLIQELRKRRLPSPIYSFGSNRNYLRHAAVGATLVCDVKYHDYNPIVQQYLQEILGKEDAGEEVSLSSVLAIHVLSQAIAQLPPSEPQRLDDDRKSLRDNLATGEFQGPFGLVAFSRQGEMIGHENISVVTVRRRGPTVFFGAPETSRIWGLHTRLKWQARIWETIIVVSTIGGVVGLVHLAFQMLQ